MNRESTQGWDHDDTVTGEFLTMAGERYYAIRNVDKMAPFFISVISNLDHWLFVSSMGGLTAGRVSPDTALFPYITVDRIHQSAAYTGSKTVVRVDMNGQQRVWEPFNTEHDGRFETSRNLYKNLLGNKLCFEEINHDLQLAFRYCWMTSDRYGFVRQCRLQNIGGQPISAALLDGLQNILPAGTPRLAQTNSSNLVNAYKWTELDESTGLAIYSLYSGISDRAEPSESLKATVFCLGIEARKTLLSSTQIGDFRAGKEPEQEEHKRGISGAYFVTTTLDLAPRASQEWLFAADIEQSQSQVVALLEHLSNPAGLATEITHSIEQGCDELARIVASGDGFQVTAEETVTAHHYANVLFNILRGGVFIEQYTLCAQDFVASVHNLNRNIYQRNSEFLNSLPDKLDFAALLSTVISQNDPQLERLCREYLPLTFGRRHGDPSRPWNQFSIRVTGATSFKIGKPCSSVIPSLSRMSSPSLSMPRPSTATTPIASPRRVSTGKWKNQTIPGAISATGVITRSSTYRNCWNYPGNFIRPLSPACCTGKYSATRMCPTGSARSNTC
jgi:hypothetical protein